MTGVSSQERRTSQFQRLKYRTDLGPGESIAIKGDAIVHITMTPKSGRRAHIVIESRLDGVEIDRLTPELAEQWRKNRLLERREFEMGPTDTTHAACDALVTLREKSGNLAHFVFKSTGLLFQARSGRNSDTADRKRLGYSKTGQPTTFEFRGETYEGTGGVERSRNGILLADAVRQSDGRKAVLVMKIDGGTPFVYDVLVSLDSI